ncbi:hypothetical protein FJR38_11645 [Anabaena sp. UHCC 0253]|uniref:hypothetical protein n=1 Tax=Anabaena sp. UHCC 0253 TaxID=2590019 RepID=UPI001C2C1DC4|nr:hypothetical protein [Anabaena sp. UHCC 0253]MTJ53250.1 hypothetical protein [Anabaena sp. UHCC 0253]
MDKIKLKIKSKKILKLIEKSYHYHQNKKGGFDPPMLKDEILDFLVRREIGLMQNRTEVGVIHELPLRKNQVLTSILRKS